MMKSRIIFLSFVIASSVSLAQEIHNNTGNTNNTNLLNTNREETTSPVMDTTVEESSFEKALKKERAKAKTAAPPVPMETEKAQESDQYRKEQSFSASSAKYQSSSQSFKSTQYQSSHNPYSRSATPVQQKQMDQTLDEMEMVAPNSFETNLYNYVAGHYDSAKDTFLLRAAEQQPENTELRQQLGAYYYIKNNIPAADSITTTLVQSGTFCAGQMNYSVDLFNSIQANSTLIVHGFNDLLPIVHQLNASENNNNVEIVSLDLLQSDDYKASLSEKGFVFPESKIIDTAFLYQFVKLNPDKNIQLSLTLPKEYFKQFLPDLYPLGLTFVLNKRPEYEDANVELWQNEWDKNILLNGTNDFSETWYSNYLPTLIVLKKHYEAIGDADEAKKINDAIVAISNRNNLNAKTKKYTSTK